MTQSSSDSILNFSSKTIGAKFYQTLLSNSGNALRTFSSPELKAKESFSDRPSSVRSSVKFSDFYLLQNHPANFYQTWHNASLGKGDSSFTS